MANAIITRHDERYTITDFSPDLPSIFKKDTGTVLNDTTYYPLGDATTVSTKSGYLYISETCQNATSANATFSYEVHIGDKTYTKTINVPRVPYDQEQSTDPNFAGYRDCKLWQVFKIPIGVTVSFKITATGTFKLCYRAAACSAE